MHRMIEQTTKNEFLKLAFRLPRFYYISMQSCKAQYFSYGKQIHISFCFTRLVINQIEGPYQQLLLNQLNRITYSNLTVQANDYEKPYYPRIWNGSG